MTKEMREIMDALKQIEERKSALSPLAETAESAEIEERAKVLDEIEAEKKQLLERKEAIEAEERAAAAIDQNEAAGEPIIPEERGKEMTNEEVRSTAAYAEAFANFIKTEKDDECRSLLTENVSGTVPVPTIVYDIVKTAWEKEGVMSRVKKVYLQGNLKVGFEISGDAAVVHTEGGNAVTEEDLVLGVVELIPQSIKKWVSISDEALDMRGEAFLEYIYDELTYRIAKKAADLLIAKIDACGTESTTTCVSVPAIASTQISVSLVAEAMALLSDEAANPVVIMNKATWGEFKKAQYANKYGLDPFEGLDVVFNNSIASFTAASSGDTYAIIGDLGQGALANFPNGDEITIKVDDKSNMKKDLVDVLGRQYVALGVVAPDAFVKITKGVKGD